MRDWEPITIFPPSNALCIFYVPEANYVWACGKDIEMIKKDYPKATHWKVMADAPDVKQKDLL